METESQSSHPIRLIGVTAAAFLLNYVFSKIIFESKKTKQDLHTHNIIQSQRQIMQKDHLRISRRETIIQQDKSEVWGTLKVKKDIGDQNPLLQELRQMDSLLFEVQRVNNLIIDLQLKHFKGIRNPMIVWKQGFRQVGSYMDQSSVVEPGSFVIRQCVFKPGFTLELQKKFMKAGPRGSIYFDPEDVRADIVCLGHISPGMNTVLRELVLVLYYNYRVKQIFGIKDSFQGYYEDKIIKLVPENIELIHHLGGCYLGVCKSEFNPTKIIDNLQKRKINQLYLIGANSTLNAAKTLYSEIKKRKNNIAITVLLKGINKQIPIFDTCFGFQTAAEQAAKSLQKAYAFSHTYKNGISMLRVPGKKSGFLAAQATISTINANACLVPQIPFDLYGDNGLLNFIVKRMKIKGNCTIVYSEGVQSGLRDCCLDRQKGDSAEAFQNFIKTELSKVLNAQKVIPHKIGVFNCVEEIRSCPTNSIDTKLCCQIAQGSVDCLMSGYTNFGLGHLGRRSAMIPIEELINAQSTTFLKEHDAIWQRVLEATGQPNFLNRNNGGSSY